MAPTVGTNTGFVSASPTADPAGNNSSIDGGSLANRDTSPSSGVDRVTELGWFMSSNTSSVDADYQIGLYDHDSANDKPDNYLGGVLSGLSTGTTNNVWHKSVGLNITVSASTIYWVCVQVDVAAGTIGVDYGNISGTREIDNPSSPTDLPDPWNNEGTGYTNYCYCFYAVYGTTPTGLNMKVNIGDSWKDVAAMKINIGDSWKDVAAIKQNIGDSWKTV